MIFDRRSVLALGLALGVSPYVSRAALGAPASKLRLAVLKFGSLNWLMDTIVAKGLDKQTGISLDLMQVATNTAGPLSLMANSSDVMVSDWLWAMRQRSKGVALKFAPFSSALGAVMTAPDSGIKTLSDLRGKKIGVAGSPIDKSWLLLRAYSRKTLGEDVGEFARPVYSAAPLIAEELKIGRIDAVLNFWTFSSRLKGSGFVEVESMDNVFKQLGIAPVPSLVGYIWKEETQAKNPEAFEAFFKAVELGNDVLATSDSDWEGLRKRMRAKSDSEFSALQESYRSGIPNGWTGAHTESARQLFGLFSEYGKAKLVGANTTFDPDLFRVTGA